MSARLTKITRSPRKLPLELFVVLAGVALGCSAWIDEFEVSSSSDDDLASDEVDDNDDGDGLTGLSDDLDEPTCGHIYKGPGGLEVELCRLPGKDFMMGCDPQTGDACGPDELPQHRVTMSSFFITRYEITGAQYQAFVTADPRWARGGEAAAAQCGSTYLDDWESGLHPASGSLEKPVTGVCWYAADAFCLWLGKDFFLPTEAQWEYAARGGGEGPYKIYAFGDTPGCEAAAYESCTKAPLPAREAKGASPWGVIGMAGNAWEWTADWYRTDYYCNPTESSGYGSNNCNDGYAWSNPKGSDHGTLKVLRGGSWYHPARMMRTAARQSLDPSVASDFSGLRCASSAL